MTEIIVGVDGSEGSALALRWAVAEGEVRQARVVAVMAWGYLDQRHAAPDSEFDPDYGPTQAEAALESLVTGALSSDEAASVERRPVNNLAADALLELSGPDAMVVVGARGLGGFKGLLLGSVSQKVLAGAKGPVAVVRASGFDTDSGGPIVVGVDGSDTASQALAWAVEEGRAHGRTVRVVHGWSAPFIGAYPFGGATFDPRMFEAAGRETLDNAIAAVDTAGVTVEPELAYGTGGAALLDAAEGASLVVVGTRGLSGIKGWLLGSVSHQVAIHAPCTVVVIPTSD